MVDIEPLCGVCGNRGAHVRETPFGSFGVYRREVVCGYCPAGKARGGRISEQSEKVTPPLRELPVMAAYKVAGWWARRYAGEPAAGVEWERWSQGKTLFAYLVREATIRDLRDRGVSTMTCKGVLCATLSAIESSMGRPLSLRVRDATTEARMCRIDGVEVARVSLPDKVYAFRF